MATAIARIVVQATAQDKKAIAAKAKRLKLPISELMRRGAFAYEPNEADEELGALADSAKAAAERAGAAIDDALDFIAASDKRIEDDGSRGAQRIYTKESADEHHRPGLGSADLHGQAGGQGEPPGRSNEGQQQRIEDLTGRVIRLEAQLELLTRAALAEDAEDLAAFEERMDEPSVSFESVVRDLRKRGRI